MAFNSRSPAVKRLMKEAQELKDPTELYAAQPLEDNIFEWHFTIRGPSDSDFDGGLYHGRILLPADYPMKPPSITFLTTNGRFKTNEKICLSISGHHPETWLPSWSIRTALLALIGFMPTFGDGALGSIEYTPEERKILAKKSVNFKCSICNVENSSFLLELTDKSQKISEEAKELAAQIDFKNKKESPLIEETKIKEDTVPTVSNSAPITTEPVNNNINETNVSRTTPPTVVTTTVNRDSPSNSSIILFILSLVFFLLLFRRLYITLSNEDTEFSGFDKEL